MPLSRPTLLAACGGLAAVLAAAGCANTPEDPCHAGETAVLGALTGAVIGAVTSKDKNKQGQRAAVGAAAGGAVGALACLAIRSSSRQTKTAGQVNDELRQRAPAVPPEPELITYDATLAPPTVRSGSDVVVSSVIVIADGSRERVSDLRERLLLRDTEGKEYALKEKVVGPGTGGAGRFENSFAFQMPQNLSQGNYLVRTELILNGRRKAQWQSAMQLVEAGRPPVMWARTEFPGQ